MAALPLPDCLSGHSDAAGREIALKPAPRRTDNWPSPMVAALYTLLGLVALGSVVTVYAALTAREGYEDADGFHNSAPENQTAGQALSEAATTR